MIFNNEDKIVISLYCVLILFNIIMWAGLGYAVIHFVIKFW